jgi:4-hydroxybenzoate polyprenyltransferase
MAQSLTTVFQLLRPGDWAKNAFVFAPLLFSERLDDLAALRMTILVALALCALSSSVYIVNDLLDAAADRRHPTKRLRPIAAGLISPQAAAGLAATLAALGCGLLGVAHVPASAWALAGGFLGLNAAYSLYLKTKVIADVLAIASGFVLRVLIGGAAIGVRVTDWLVICTFLLATFLGFSKRRHELVVLGKESERHRPVLELYSEEFLDRASLLTLAMTLTCYILYTRSPDTIARFGTHALVYSSLIVMFALFRYLFLIHVKKLGSPTEILYRDRQIVLAVVAWVLYVIVVVYTWPGVTGPRL